MEWRTSSGDDRYSPPGATPSAQMRPYHTSERQGGKADALREQERGARRTTGRVHQVVAALCHKRSVHCWAEPIELGNERVLYEKFRRIALAWGEVSAECDRTSGMASSTNLEPVNAHFGDGKDGHLRQQGAEDVGVGGHGVAELGPVAQPDQA